jgi:hypothetical protein
VKAPACGRSNNGRRCRQRGPPGSRVARSGRRPARRRHGPLPT